MGTLGVAGVGKTLGDVTPLHGEVVVIVERGHLVDTPAEGAVVEHDLVALTTPGGIGSVVDILHLTTAEADVAHDDIVALAEVNRVVTEGDTRLWRCLSGNRRIRGDVELGLQIDIAADVEDDGLGLVALQGLTERTLAGIVEVGDVTNFAATAASDVTGMPFGTGESGNLLLSRGSNSQSGRQDGKENLFHICSISYC